MRRLGETAARIVQATHHLWGGGCFYVGLDLPQVPGLILELCLNIIVCLGASKYLVNMA